MPAVIAILNQAIFSQLQTAWRTDLVMAVLLPLLVVEIGVMGLLCGRLIEWPVMRWIVYGWCWLVVDVQALLAWQVAEERGYRSRNECLPEALFAAQLGLVTIWAVLGRARWTTCWPAAFVATCLLLVPVLRARFSYFDMGLVLIAVQGIVLVSICTGLRWQGFRLTSRRPESSTVPGADLQATQFGLRHVLIWTTALALVCGVIRAAGVTFNSLLDRSWDQWASIIINGISVGMAFVVALFGALGHASAQRRWLAELLITPLLGLVSGAIEWVGWIRLLRVVQTVGGPWWPNVSWQGFFVYERWLILWVCLAGGMLFATLLYLRSIGYRLEKESDREPE